MSAGALPDLDAFLPLWVKRLDVSNRRRTNGRTTRSGGFERLCSVWMAFMAWTFQAMNAIQTEHSLSKPPLLVVLPFVLRRVKTSGASPPAAGGTHPAAGSAPADASSMSLIGLGSELSPCASCSMGAVRQPPVRGVAWWCRRSRHTAPHRMCASIPKDFLHELCWPSTISAPVMGIRVRLEDRAGADGSPPGMPSWPRARPQDVGGSAVQPRWLAAYDCACSTSR